MAKCSDTTAQMSVIPFRMEVVIIVPCNSIAYKNGLVKALKFGGGAKIKGNETSAHEGAKIKGAKIKGSQN